MSLDAGVRHLRQIWKRYSNPLKNDLMPATCASAGGQTVFKSGEKIHCEIQSTGIFLQAPVSALEAFPHMSIETEYLTNTLK